MQTKNKQCKSAVMLQCYHPHLSDFCSQPRLTQPCNHTIYSGVAKIYLVLSSESVVSADVTISVPVFHIFTILGAKENFLKS